MYIKNIKDKFGKFQHAPSKINLDPKKEEEQLKLLYPNVRKTKDWASVQTVAFAFWLEITVLMLNLVRQLNFNWSSLT